jgi:hypothetical protein
MTKRIEHLRDRDVLTLSAKEVDEIIAYNRALTAAYEKDMAKQAGRRKAALKSGVVIPFPGRGAA